MASHGQARQDAITALSARQAFRRPGFGMSAVQGSVSGTGRLPEPYAAQYAELARIGMITYTVLSYDTPILWVTDGSTVSCPDVKYSATTSTHQGMARCYA